MVTRSDYQKDAVNACLSVMIEVMTILGEFRDHIVLIGGWVPFFLLKEKEITQQLKDHVNLSYGFSGY